MTGYRRLVSPDPAEQALRDKWHETKEALDPAEAGSVLRHTLADKALTEFLWRRVNTIVAKDRAKHPKAKRNMAVGSMGSNKTRALP